jgi:cystinosin
MTLNVRQFLQALSQGLGWTYFLLWSVSFYPQLIHNQRRRATSGFSLDFALLNVLGLSAYTVFNGGLLFSPVIRAQYAQRHPQSPEPPVHLNDFFYALHGTIICLLIYSQFQWPVLWKFESQNQTQRKPSILTVVLLSGCFGLVAVEVTGLLYFPQLHSQQWLDVVSFIILGRRKNVGLVSDILFITSYTQLETSKCSSPRLNTPRRHG